jgi:FkbM family methyltransferase
VSDQPWRLNLRDDIEMVAPKGGAGALIYYQGCSEPETARFLTAFLKPGMTFWDVGAHIGEYSLLAARSVGGTGHVHGFEPQPKMFEFLRRNVAANQLSNVTPHRLAVSDRVGSAEFSLHPEPSMAFLNPIDFRDPALPTISVTTISLDEFWKSSGRLPNLVKVDVEGAERPILEGAESLLQLPPDRAPLWIMECDERNCSRFGYSATDLLNVFSDHGFETKWIMWNGALEATSSFSGRPDARNILAVKRDLEC